MSAASTGTLRLRWLGCAGFRLEFDGVGLLIDPWISRNPWASPPFVCAPEELWPADAVILSHGHFDHAADLPHLSQGRELPIFAAENTARVLEKHGVARANLRPVRPGWRGRVGPYDLRCEGIHHIWYGLSLILRTARRAGRHALSLAPLLAWPCGQALAWRIDVGGRSLVHMGTSGATPYELERVAVGGPVDVLLVALQGNDRIHAIAANIVGALSPKLVIPHHQDDFYPPLSAAIPVAPFEDLVSRTSPGTRVHELRCGEVLPLPPLSLNNRAGRA